MKKLFIILFLMIVQVLFAQKPKVDYIFKNVNVVTMKDDKVLKNKTIAIQEGKIIEIADKTNYKSENTIDAKGKYILPTLADAHVHFPESEEELERVLKLNLINGVTKLRSMRGDWKHLELREKFNAANSYYPKLYLTAPPIHQSFDLTEEQINAYVQTAKKHNINQIKILSIKDQNTFQLLSDKTLEYDLPLGGHFPTTAEGSLEDDVFFQSNYSTIEHLGGLIGEPKKYEYRVQHIKEKRIYICPTLQWYAIGYGQYSIDEMLNQKGMEYIADEIKTDWAEKSKIYREKLGKQGFEEEKTKYALEMQERFKVIKRLNDEGVKLLLSPDSSSKFIVPGFGVLEEMKLYQKAGLSNFDILRSATTNFASLFDENYGIIEKGKDAEFILLSENPLENLNTLENVEAVFYNKSYLDKKQLNEIAKSVLPN